MPVSPTFLGIGCQNCGTTWAAACVAQHPSVFMPSRKELSFFDSDYERGWEWYLSQFSEVGQAKCIGEWSPGYICTEEALPRAAHWLPDVKILALFRNPVDRLFSHYWRYRAQGATHLPFLKAIESDPSYIRMSLYAEDWRKWSNQYGKTNCHAMFFEELIADPEVHFRSLFRFLGIDSRFTPNVEAARRRQNPIQLNRRQWIMDAVSRTREQFRRFGFSGAVSLAKKLGLRRLLISMAGPTTDGYQGESLDFAERLRIYQRHFARDVDKLSQLLNGRDLSVWTPREFLGSDREAE